ncbi:chitin synthase III catalytic subunit [Pilobolus umbonatus]|nr:chitin synthase III catalytic subunit [Pilobolus umbonatus]
MGKFDGIEPICYSRNVEIAGILVFQPATLMMDLLTLFMTGIMIYHVKSKHTAVGKEEIVMFFQMYMVTIFLEMLLITNIIPTASILYPYFTAIHIGLMSSSFWCLLLNGFVGFQFAEDGTPISLWYIRITSFSMFLIVGFVAIATFNNLGPFTHTSPMALWILFFIINGAMFLVYTISQVILVIYTLNDRWPLGDIAFGVLFFVSGVIINFIFSIALCEETKHYIDGVFFGSMCNLLAVMMVYKYWDSITKEDMEFSIDSKHHIWEIQALLDDEEKLANQNKPE